MDNNKEKANAFSQEPMYPYGTLVKNGLTILEESTLWAFLSVFDSLEESVLETVLNIEKITNNKVIDNLPIIEALKRRGIAIDAVTTIKHS